MKTYPEMIAEGIKRTIFQEEQTLNEDNFNKLAKKVAAGLNKVYPDNPKTAKHFDANQSNSGSIDTDKIWSEIFKAARMKDDEIEEFAEILNDEDLSGSDLVNELGKNGWKFGKKLDKMKPDQVNDDALEIMYDGWDQ